MGCKFSITLDQQRPKTPSFFNKKSPRTSMDQTAQTAEAGAPDEEAGAPDEEAGAPDEEADCLSSPEQVDVKTLKKSARWKP